VVYLELLLREMLIDIIKCLLYKGAD